MRTTGYSTPVAALIAGAFVSITIAASILGSVTRSTHVPQHTPVHVSQHTLETRQSQVNEIIAESESWTVTHAPATLYLRSLNTQTSDHGLAVAAAQPSRGSIPKSEAPAQTVSSLTNSSLMNRPPGHYGPALNVSQVTALALSISSGDQAWVDRLLPIAMCESGIPSEGLYYFGAISPEGDGGFLQVKYSVWKNKYDFDRMLTDPAYAVWVGWDIYNLPEVRAMYRGNGWGPWGCQFAY